MRNVMLIYPRPDSNKNPRFGFSYNMLTIATILEQEGYKIFIKDFSYEHYNSSYLCSELIDNNIEIAIIEFDSFSLKRSENFMHGQNLVEAIKGLNNKTVIIAYGNYCCIKNQDIVNANFTVKENNVNIIIDIINEINISNNKISNIYDFDSIPFINRKLLEQIEYFRSNNKSTLIQTAIGCENTCVFCQRKGWQKKYQAHSEKYVLDEFQILKEQGCTNIWIVDENFTFNINRAKRILKLLIEHKVTEKMKIFISSWSNIDNEFIELASMSNIKTISFGVESGNQQILNFYRKNIDLHKTRTIVEYANKIGIFTIGNFIIGAPMESYDTIDETFRFIKQCQFDQVNIKTLDYMIGSELYQSIEKVAKGCSHMFACAENGINQFSLQEITDIKSRFLNEYYEEKKDHLKDKIIKFGTPYNLM